MGAPQKIAVPERELRFTRNQQAIAFYIGASFLISVSIVLCATAFSEAPPLHWAWSLLPLPFAAVCLKTALFCSRHAYLILSPIGVEVFPFRKAQKEMQVVQWGEIDDIETKSNQLLLHFNPKKTAGMVITLRPLRPAQRNLLQSALLGVMQQRSSPPSPDLQNN